MKMDEFKGWILQFDIKEAWDAGLDCNPLFQQLENYDALVEQLFPQWHIFHSDVSELSDLDRSKEMFCSDLFYKLPPEYNQYSIEALCDMLRKHSFWYPGDFYYDGSLYTADIKGHRVRQSNKTNICH